MRSRDMKQAMLFFLAIFIIAVVGCDVAVERSLIPKRELSSQQENVIRQAIAKNDRAKLRQIGKPAVPLILERIFEIYNSKPWRQDPIWADAANLVILLGDIGDERAVPALTHMLVDIKYRVFRGDAAYSLGNIGDKRSIEPLWTAFKQEKSYLEKGDRKGPDYGWGVAGNYTEQMLGHIGMALEKLGEKPGDYPNPFHGWGL